MSHNLEFRLASPDDIDGIQELHRRSPKNGEDNLLGETQKLREGILSENYMVFLGETGRRLRALLSFFIDREQLFAKLHQLHLDPDLPRNETAAEILRFATERMFSKGSAELIYSTTRTMTFEQQQHTLQQGFAVLGIFPSGPGADPHKINGITAAYAPHVLARRHSAFSLHPGIAPLYEIVRVQLALEAIPTASPEPLDHAFEPLPELEWIDAPLFVGRHFRDLKKRGFLTNHFYPFQEPNALVTDPSQGVEVFLKIASKERFATIIGERVNTRVHPVRLYKKVLGLLKDRDFSYIEVVNDAADRSGVDCIMKAGFIPCAYIPAFKAQGKTRRDYAVFVHAERTPGKARDDVNPLYLQFLEYCLKTAELREW